MDHSGLHSGVNHLQGGDTWWFAIMGCYIGNGQASMGLKHYSVVVYHTCWNNIGILWLYCPLHDTACSHVYFLVHGQIGRSQRRKKNGTIWMAMNGWADWFDMNGCMSLVWPTMAWWHSAHGSVDWIGCLVFHRIAKKGVWKCGLFPEFIAMSVMFVILDLFMVHVWFYGGEDGLPLCFGSFWKFVAEFAIH